MKKKLVLVGCGGHALSTYDIILQNDDHEILGFINPRGEKFYDLQYLGSEDYFIENFPKDIQVIIGLGQVKDLNLRDTIYKKFLLAGFKIPTLIAKSAVVSKNSMIQSGSIIMHNVIINAKAEIHENSIINNNALIEHSSIIGKNTHISTGAIVNGDCYIGNNCFIGSNSTINHGLRIKNFSIIPSHSRISKSV